jgi:hypothetical protein
MAVGRDSRWRITRGSALAGLWLVGALPLGLALVMLVSRITSTELTVESRTFLIPFLAAYLIAGGLWGHRLGRIAGYNRSRSFIVAGAIGVALPTGVAVTALTYVEQNLAVLLWGGLPVHVIFGFSFALAALVLSGIAGLAFGLSLGSARLARQLAVGGGGAGALTFVIVDIGLDVLGFRVGAPNAEQRATMLVVAVVGLWATAIVGSAVLGRILAQEGAKRTSPAGR